MTNDNHPRPRVKPGFLLLSTLLAGVLLLAQGPGQQPQGPPKEKKEEKKEQPPPRTFTGKITLRSSRQESETATYGFKGVGDDGTVQKAALATQASGSDYAKVGEMASYKLPSEELQAFLEKGGLHGRTGAPKEKKTP